MNPFLVLLAVLAQATPPDTEIFVASLSTVGGKITIGTPRNISNSPGYDNQPSFTPDGSAILFTSVRGGRKPDPANAAATGSDIYRYDLTSGHASAADRYPGERVLPDGHAGWRARVGHQG